MDNEKIINLIENDMFDDILLDGSIKIIPKANQKDVYYDKNFEFSVLGYAIYKGAINIIEKFKDKLSLDTPVYHVPIKYSDNYQNITLEKMIFNSIFMKKNDKKGISSLLSLMKDVDFSKIEEKMSNYPGEIKDSKFSKEILPFFIENGNKNIIEAIIYPLMYNYDQTLKTYMKSGSLNDLIFISQLMYDTKKDFDNISKTKSVYKINGISLRESLRTSSNINMIFLDLFSPDKLYEMLVSSKKSDEEDVLKKINYFFSRLNKNEIDFICEKMEQAALKLNPNDMKSISLIKETPVSYAANKGMKKIVSYFFKHGYTFNNAELKYFNGINFDIENEGMHIPNNKEKNLFDTFLAIMSKDGKRANSALQKMLEEMDNDDKESIFKQLHLINEQKEKDYNDIYSINKSRNYFLGSNNFTPVASLIVKNKRQMLSSLLENGYKLTYKEYGLMNIMFTLESYDDKCNTPESTRNILDKMMEYPDNYQAYFIEKFIQRNRNHPASSTGKVLDLPIFTDQDEIMNRVFVKNPDMLLKNENLSKDLIYVLTKKLIFPYTSIMNNLFDNFNLHDSIKIDALWANVSKINASMPYNKDYHTNESFKKFLVNTFDSLDNELINELLNNKMKFIKQDVMSLYNEYKAISEKKVLGDALSSVQNNFSVSKKRI